MSTYTANLIKDADTTTPTSGTWTVPEADDAIREIKRIVAYNEGVTAVSAYPATVAVTDTTLYCTGAGGTLNIPQLSTVSTTAYQKRIVVINDSSAALTFDPYSTETVGGASTYSIPVGTIAEFLGHGGTDWEIIRIPASATPVVNTTPIQAASLNTPFGPCFSAYRNSSNQALTGSGTIDEIIFNAEEWDLGSCYDTSTGRFTPNVAGKYFVTSQIWQSSYSIGKTNIIRASKNGTPVKANQQYVGAAANDLVSITCVIDMNGTTDYISIRYSVSDTTSVPTVLANQFSTYFQAYRIF